MDASGDRRTRTLLTTKEVGDQIRCSERTVRRLIKEYQLHAVRVGKRLLVPADAVSAYLTKAGWTGPSAK